MERVRHATRRRVLSFAGAVLAAPALARTADDSLLDCVIVGAGAAGLAAARVLVEARRRVLVIEARSRLGGRAFTDHVAGVPFDAGASYVHFAERNPWVAWASAAGVPLVDDTQTGLTLFEDGQRIPDEVRRARRSGFGRLSAALDALEPGTPDVSIDAYARGLDPALAGAARGITRMSLGEEPDRVSVRDYARLWSGDDRLVPGGYGKLVERSGTGLPVRLGTRAERIDWSDRIAVETAAGTLRARCAIVTVPLGVLAAGGITFAPQLPATTRDAVNGLRMGALTKIALAVDGDRLGWPDPTDLIDTRRGGVDYELWPFGRPLVVATLGGDAARDLVALGEAAAVAEITGQFVSLVGADAGRHVGAGRLAGWSADPLAGGSFSICLQGHAEARQRLGVPVAERLYFAGEATGGPGEAVGAAMTVGGASLAGAGAARQVLAALSRKR